MKRINIPGELQSRHDDVAYPGSLPEHWHGCTPTQQQWAITEARHVIELIDSGTSWYEGISRYAIRRSMVAFLAKVS